MGAILICAAELYCRGETAHINIILQPPLIQDLSFLPCGSHTRLPFSHTPLHTHTHTSTGRDISQKAKGRPGETPSRSFACCCTCVARLAASLPPQHPPPIQPAFLPTRKCMLLVATRHTSRFSSSRRASCLVLLVVGLRGQ